MKEKLSIRVIILLAYFILSIGGNEGKCIKGGRNTCRVLMNRQVNKTIMVCACILLIMYIYPHFCDYYEDDEIKIGWRRRCIWLRWCESTTRLWPPIAERSQNPGQLLSRCYGYSYVVGKLNVNVHVWIHNEGRVL